MGMVFFLQTGAYQVQFIVPGSKDPPTATILVHVVDCPVGNVTSVTRDACQACESGYCSLDPRNHTCDMCVPNAECPGGALVEPIPGFWHSVPHNMQMHRWAVCFEWLHHPAHVPAKVLPSLMVSMVQ